MYKNGQEMVAFLPLCVVWVWGEGGGRDLGGPPTPQVMELGRLGVPGGGVMKGLGGEGGVKGLQTP